MYTVTSNTGWRRSRRSVLAIRAHSRHAPRSNDDSTRYQHWLSDGVMTAALATHWNATHDERFDDERSEHCHFGWHADTRTTVRFERWELSVEFRAPGSWGPPGYRGKALSKRAKSWVRDAYPHFPENALAVERSTDQVVNAPFRGRRSTGTLQYRVQETGRGWAPPPHKDPAILGTTTYVDAPLRGRRVISWRHVTGPNRLPRAAAALAAEWNLH